MKKFFQSTAVKLLLSIAVGIALGFLLMLLPDSWMGVPVQVLMIAKQVTSQVILFVVPLIIIGCVAPSITSFKGNVTKLLGLTLGIAYLSSILAAAMSMGVSFLTVPLFGNGIAETSTRALPQSIISLQFPTMDTMSALLLAILVGLGTVWIGSERFQHALADFQDMILTIVRRVMIPILPVFVASNFALLAIEGKLGQMVIFFPSILILICCQLFWIVLLYVVATIYTRKNGWQVLKYYGQAYFTAVGTMSSAATLPVALDCIGKSPIINKKTSDFSVPLFSNIHICGSVIAEVFLVVTTYHLLYGHLPELTNMIIFIVLASVIAIGSPGVPGGINMSCASLVGTIVLGGADATTFFGIMTAIYTVQDGFGTACNVTCDGALTLITDTYLERNAAKENN